jgi:hypothetical protein
MASVSEQLHERQASLAMRKKVRGARKFCIEMLDDLLHA